MSTAEQVLGVARSQIGTVEAADGSNPYGAAYGVNRVAWCAQFCWWVFRQAGVGGLLHPKTAYCPTLFDWFRAHGQLDMNPRPGDLVFYDWPDQTREVQHVGIVEAVEPGSIITIEGNTASGQAGDQSNGGGVWRRRRARNNSIAGYGHPAYTGAPPALSLEDDMPSVNDLWSAPISDYYTENATDSLPAGSALGWAAANAAQARDAAKAAATAATAAINACARAEATAARVEAKLDTLLKSGLPTTAAGPQVAPDALAAAVRAAVEGVRLTTKL